MKLKEKLMRDYVETRRGHQDQYSELLEHCWYDAFEKAREMSAQKIKASVMEKSDCSFYDDSFINQRLQAKHDHDLCLTIGEEDV